jgi:hypothetical protein
MLSKFHSKFKFQEGILLNSKPRSFSKFSFEIHSESEGVSMEKVVHLFVIFKPIFNLKNFELGKVLSGSFKLWRVSN